MRSNIRFAFAIQIILSLGLVGCSSVSPDFADMSQTYQRTIEKYQNNNLLLNIIRSSQNMPMSFIDIPSVIGTGNVSETAGISGLIYSASAGSGPSGLFTAAAGGGYAASYYMPSVSLTLGRSFNFTQSSMENAQFEKEFLSTIPIQTIHYFNKRHTPREFIFTLAIDEIIIKEPNGTTKRYYNNPTVGNFSEFQTLLRQLVSYGLTTEILKLDSPVGPPLEIAKIEMTLGQIILQYVGIKDKDKLNFKPVSEKNSNLYQISQEKEVPRFCFDPVAIEVKDVQREFGETMFCQSSLSNSKQKIENIGITGTVSKDNSKKSISLILRSNKDVYRYLGEVFIAQSQGDPRMEFLTTPVILKNGKGQITNEQVPLLVIKKDPEIATKTIASIEYDGAVYAIPAQNNGYSAMVLDILSQFLSLNKIPGSIPPSPAVLVK